jgi:IS4 transposase
MQQPPTLFSQITCALHAAEFSRAAQKFPGAKPARGLAEYDHFLALCFGQLTYRESLRDIIACLKAKPRLLYHMGFRGRITRTNLAYANKHRDWRLFQSLAEILMRRAAALYRDHSDHAVLPGLVFALDSSIISLALNLFPWGYYFRTGKAALKLHLMLSLRGNLPAWAVMTDTRVGDMRMLDEIPIYPGAHYVMDRGYMDFVRLFRLHQSGAFFVVRCKEPVSFRVLSRRIMEKNSDYKCDQTVRLKSNWSAKSFPRPLRKIRIYDPKNKIKLVLLTNNFLLPMVTVGELYQRRWQIELFFKWIKQHLRLRAFYGRSENAVRCQIWSAICAYLMVAILKKRTGTEKSLNEILQICSVSIFEQMPAAELLADENHSKGEIETEKENQKSFLFNDI